MLPKGGGTRPKSISGGSSAKKEGRRDSTLNTNLYQLKFIGNNVIINLLYIVNLEVFVL
jgi:hypothetical protein